VLNLIQVKLKINIYIGDGAEGTEAGSNGGFQASPGFPVFSGNPEIRRSGHDGQGAPDSRNLDSQATQGLIHRHLH
jgi:hypothetical protein